MNAVFLGALVRRLIVFALLPVTVLWLGWFLTIALVPCPPRGESA